MKLMHVPDISILILTRDEEQNLPACLASVAWCDDVVVLDSFSTDRTRAIAEAHGARVICRRFDNFGAQRNHALDTVAFRHRWIFHLDADERFTDVLLHECEARIAEDRFSGFMVPSKLLLWNRWLRHAGCYPVYQMRFHKLGELRFEQHGHGQREQGAQRGIGRLSEPYLHHNFSKGLEEWFTKHARYAAQEARQDSAGALAGAPSLAALVQRDPVARRRALKAVAARMPLRPWLKFFYLYLWRRGFLDGAAGLVYCRMLAVYETMIVIHLQALRRERAGESGGARPSGEGSGT